MQNEKNAWTDFFSRIVTIQELYSFSDFVKVLVLPILAIALVAGLFISIFQEQNMVLSALMYLAVIFTITGLAVKSKWTLESVGISNRGLLRNIIYSLLYLVIVVAVNYDGTIISN
ncbi:MAG: hypothetical protein ACP6IU_11860 [Candidatus Asgardarchaeia archaeon]